MSKILIVAEITDGSLNPNIAKVIACANAIGGEVDVLVFGNATGCENLPVARVLNVSLENEDSGSIGAAVATALAEFLNANDYSHVLMAGSSFGRDVMPYAAGILGLPQVTDIMRVDGPHAFARPAYAGNVIETITVDASIPCLGTVRLASFKPVELDGSASAESVSVSGSVAHTKRIEVRASSSDRPDLMSAAKVVSGGRGVGGSEGFETINAMADAIGAAVGASRAAVDAGFIGNDHQVGQTSKIIAPDFYFAFGISGAIQHLAGIKDAGTIIAINKDADASIFDVADIGYVGDLFEVIPELIERLG